ncbi:hypothetical protein Sliba_43220 [Streptomyces nigrescens]|uniref:Uncharacterized protein n=1 Tax=Streptomyces nigrescens TaxID=1920 RepID=A0A640TJW5_STRNI|nr:hypothetical protein Sliba_43220 [Streptomyces libani subsp. libani]GGV99232.1 hypothetical protein GCM10010500_49340 [Streptomyces libani subsp. libani]
MTGVRIAGAGSPFSIARRRGTGTAQGPGAAWRGSGRRHEAGAGTRRAQETGPARRGSGDPQGARDGKPVVITAYDKRVPPEAT